MRVFRFCFAEDNSAGPYNSDRCFTEDIDLWFDFQNELHENHSCDPKHPSFWGDKWTNYEGNKVQEPKLFHYSGFLSESDAKEWFGEFFDRLFGFGYELKEFEVEEKYILRGTLQIAFELDKAKELATV